VGKDREREMEEIERLDGKTKEMEKKKKKKK
jgi:hypothetical protein